MKILTRHPVRLRSRLLLALIAAFAGCTGSEPRDAALGNERALAPFYRALAAAEADGTRLAILQIGDSHSANDSFSSRMRELMQARFGDGGRGLLPPGVPFAYYRPSRVRVTTTGWTLARSGSEPPDAGPFGLAGIRQRGSAGAAMTLTAAPADLARVTVEALGQPGGGTVDITTSDGQAATFPTTTAQPAVLRATVPSTASTTAVTLTARGDGPVDLLAWTADHPATAGVTWSNLGTIGGTVALLQRWDRSLLAAEAQALDPALIVLAFGTNEGFKDSTDLDAYPVLLRDAIHVLRAAAPHATILLAGPPGGVRPSRSSAGTPCPDDRWVVPPNLPRIRAIERQVAADENAYFWDWSASMGGDCAIAAWADMQPPLAARDHVHLLQLGYRRTAEALFAAIMAGYDRFRHGAGRA